MASKTFRTVAGGLLAAALVTGAGMATAGPAAAAGPAVATRPATAGALPAGAVTTLAIATAPRTRGIFPDPISCLVAGALSGQAYECNWWFFLGFWELKY
ncbi:hypothetical protein [Cellulomonas sp. URHB0016]